MDTARPAHEFGRTVQLADGRVVTVTPLTPADAPELAEAFRHADPDTLHRRFCGAPPRLSPQLLRHLTELDYERRFALVARDRGGHGVAIARYEPTERPDVAEVAVAVDPAWRRVGLATALLSVLAEAALDRGIHEFSATYLAANLPVAAILDEAGGRRVIADGIAEGAVRLDHRSPARVPGGQEPGTATVKR